MNAALKLENEFWTNFSPILQKYAPRKASLYNLKISIFFFHYSSFQISSQKSASKSRRKKFIHQIECSIIGN